MSAKLYKLITELTSTSTTPHHTAAHHTIRHTFKQTKTKYKTNKAVIYLLVLGTKLILLDSLLQEVCMNSGLKDYPAVSFCRAQFFQPGNPNNPKLVIIGKPAIYLLYFSLSVCEAGS